METGVKRTTCYQITDIIPQWPITLVQLGKDDFIVTYGKQVDARLDYSHAACKLGQAIMHALACESKLDNRAKGEK
jgi:hypothetical protein